MNNKLVSYRSLYSIYVVKEELLFWKYLINVASTEFNPRSTGAPLDFWGYIEGRVECHFTVHALRTQRAVCADAPMRNALLLWLHTSVQFFVCQIKLIIVLSLNLILSGNLQTIAKSDGKNKQIQIFFDICIRLGFINYK